VFENMRDSIFKQKDEIEEKRKDVLTNILSLSQSIKQIDDDILSLTKEINSINSKIVNVKQDLKKNEDKISQINEQIEKTSEVIIEYLVYLYKKSNAIYSEWEIDNLKAALLSNENLDEVLWDLYYKELISLAWKNLIDKHKKLIFSLYVEQKDLEEKQKKLSQLRNDSIIKKKSLWDKKEFKEKMLEISKWEDAVYRKYINDKLDAERELRIKSYKEKLRFSEISKDILEKSWCKYVDLWKIPESESWLSWQCLELNKMLYSESKLLSFPTNTQNILSWPVAPIRWVSAYFKDPEYEKTIWMEHTWIDIPESQWKDIVAPADWYVVYINPPVDKWYAYMALKHSNWFVTVYGHISEVYPNITKYSFVKKWDAFAKVWWSTWTNWAWLMTTWSHLHFEVWKDQNLRDPFEFLNIAWLNYNTLSDKHRLKFYTDYKEVTWNDFDLSKVSNARVLKLEWNNEIERQKSLLSKYARSDFNNRDMWVEEALNANIDPTFMMCIWLAESGLWRSMKTPYNVWNIWNTDSGATTTFSNPREWVYRMWKTLNNKYLKNITSMALLSGAGREVVWAAKCGAWSSCYATDRNHWHGNVQRCLTYVKWIYIADDWNFRLK